MLKYPLISVVILNYNHGHVIHDNLLGLLSQTYKNWEAIIVDDGSSDNSREVVADFAQKDSRFKPIFLPKNIGIQEAFKVGYKHVAGELFYSSAADDLIINPDFFRICVKEFHEYQNIDIVFLKTRIIDSEDNKFMCNIGYSPKKYLSGREAARFYFHRIFLIPGSSAIIKTKAVNTIGMHDDLGPQVDHFLVHAAAAINGCVFIEDVAMSMRYSPNTYGANSDFISYIERHARLEKYFRNLLALVNDTVDRQIFKSWRESIINDEKGRIGDFDKLAQHVDRFFSNLTIEHFTLFKTIIIEFKPKLDEFAKTVNQQVAEKRKVAHEIFDNVAGKID